LCLVILGGGPGSLRDEEIHVVLQLGQRNIIRVILLSIFQNFLFIRKESREEIIIFFFGERLCPVLETYSKETGITGQSLNGFDQIGLQRSLVGLRDVVGDKLKRRKTKRKREAMFQQWHERRKKKKKKKKKVPPAKVGSFRYFSIARV